MVEQKNRLSWALGVVLVALGADALAQAAVPENTDPPRRHRQKRDKAATEASQSQLQPQAEADRPATRTPEERRQLRQDIEQAGQAVYGGKHRRERR